MIKVEQFLEILYVIQLGNCCIAFVFQNAEHQDIQLCVVCYFEGGT